MVCRIDGYLQKMGFVKSDADPNLYYMVVENEPLILVLYVDDLFLDRIIQAHRGLQEESSHKIRHEGFGKHALFPRVGSLAAEG